MIRIIIVLISDFPPNHIVNVNKSRTYGQESEQLNFPVFETLSKKNIYISESLNLVFPRLIA